MEMHDVSRLATARQWTRVGTQRRLGLVVPLFSLRTRRSAGIGDAADLTALVDWAERIGASVLQLLPLNDLGLGTGPYGAISAFANDPIYIAIDKVPGVADDPRFSERAAALVRELEPSRRVDYARVRAAKLAFLEDLFTKRRAAVEADDDFRSWVGENRGWIEDYVLYRTIREDRGWASWEAWAGEFADRGATTRFAAIHEARLQFHRFLQWTLDRQLEAARRYAAAHGVLIKGDIPILVDRASVDVWKNPRYFRMDTSAGAPPDMYAADGQNWGFPTYEWPALWQDGCGWWRARLQRAEKFFDLFRIDHVVGLFRIWTIPYGRQGGKDGAFVPGDERTWGGHGRGILQMMLDATLMLPCAEDLGTIPDVCRQVLAEMGICGLKVARWEKRWNTDRTFILPKDYPALSVATLSTHDSDTLAGWWRDQPAERQQLFETLGHTGTAPETITPALQEELVRQLAGGASTFVLLMLQDILAPFGLLAANPDDDRVNVPGITNDTNWTWRMPMAIEALLEDEGLTARLKAMLRR